MDAHALLTSQGWRGSGHSLHATSDARGLSRPILVSQKQNVLGVGKKQHRTSDMWWMNAFDKSLKGLDTSKEGKVVQTVTNGGLDMVKKGGAKFVGSGGLYACFVRGEGLTGTLTAEEKIEDGEQPTKKRKRDLVRAETKEERRARKAARHARDNKEGNVPETKAELNFTKVYDEEAHEKSTLETKAERKERRRLKKLLRAKEQEAVNASAMMEKTKKKKRRKEEC